MKKKIGFYIWQTNSDEIAAFITEKKQPTHTFRQMERKINGNKVISEKVIFFTQI